MDWYDFSQLLAMSWLSESTLRAVELSCWTSSPTPSRLENTWRASRWNSRAFASLRLSAKIYRRWWCRYRIAPAANGDRWKPLDFSAWCPSHTRMLWFSPDANWNASSACRDRWPISWPRCTKTVPKRNGWPNTPAITWPTIWSHSKSVSRKRVNTVWIFTRERSIQWERAAATMPNTATRNTCWHTAVNIWSTLRNAIKSRYDDTEKISPIDDRSIAAYQILLLLSF